MNEKLNINLPKYDLKYNSNVYIPSDDTYLFIDALKNEQHFLNQNVQPTIGLEIGCGSGVIFSYLNHLLNKNIFIFGSDINPDAVKSSLVTSKLNHVYYIDLIQMDLINNIKKRLKNQVDIVVFNPPYVPTPIEEMNSNDIKAAWAGGKNGREVIDRILPEIDYILSKNGVFYMVIVQENKPKQIEKIMLNYGFQMQNILTKRKHNEKLSILKFTRISK